MKYDVIIIGGGLAGLSLSLDLKKRGYQVLVIEKGSYPRHKVCGEYISMESQRYLQAICPSLAEYQLPIIDRFRLTSTGEKEFSIPLGLGGFGISRYMLEDLLYKEACRQGVAFLLDTKAAHVTHDPGNNVFRVGLKSGEREGRLVCNASGRRSNLEAAEEKNNNGTNYIGIKYHVKIPRNPSLIEIHNFPGGYCGISNIEEDKSCLCYIVNAKELNAANKSVPELESRVLFQNPHLKKIFTKAEFVSKEPVTISGINFRIKEPANENCFFLGDSAGSIAPVTGNGMSMGLRSASVLAENIDLYFSGKTGRDQVYKTYTGFWNKEFAMRIKLSRYFQKLSEYPSLTKMTINAFNAFPSLAGFVIKQTHGKPF